MILREGFEWVRDLCDFERVASQSLIFSKGVYLWVWKNDSSSIYLMRSAYRFIHERSSEVDERPG